MLVDFRPVSRLSGDIPVDVGAVLSRVVDRLVAEGANLSQVRVVCDWIQYKNNFREIVQVRPICGGTEGAVEVAVDLRRATNADMSLAVSEAVGGTVGSTAGQPRRVTEGAVLEDFGPGSASRIWDFNALYWRHLDLWENAVGRGYEQALPGGSSDARNVDGVRQIINQLFEVWDDLAARHALPEELYVVEFGVGNGSQAKVWLDELQRMDAERGSEYYRRLRYLMCDYSPYVLKLARMAVGEHASRVSSFPLDATTPLKALSFLQHKVFLAYISNVYDNLPSDELVQIGGRCYLVECRAYLPEQTAKALAVDAFSAVRDLPRLIRKLLVLGPELASEAMPAHWPDVDAAVRFWQRAWAGIRLDERYVPLSGLDDYRITSEVNGEVLRPFVTQGDNVRLHVNNRAVASFVDTLQLLHPYGRLISHDLFVQNTAEYRTVFRGPGKYDGSVVNWINGPLLAHIAARRGFDLNYAPFGHRRGTNIITLTAQARD